MSSFVKFFNDMFGIPTVTARDRIQLNEVERMSRSMQTSLWQAENTLRVIKNQLKVTKEIAKGLTEQRADIQNVNSKLTELTMMTSNPKEIRQVLKSTQESLSTTLLSAEGLLSHIEEFGIKCLKEDGSEDDEPLNQGSHAASSGTKRKACALGKGSGGGDHPKQPKK